MEHSLVSGAVVLALFGATTIAAPVKMNLKLTVGQTDKMTIAIDAEQTKSSDSDPTPRQEKIKVEIDATLTVITAGDAGTLVQMTYDRIKVATSALGKKLAFDSAKDKFEANNSLSALAAIVGNKLTVHVAHDGRADKVTGTGDIVKKVSQQSRDGMVTMIVQNAVNQDVIQHAFDFGFAGPLPSKPIEIGDKWETDFSEKERADRLSMKLMIENKLAAVDDKNGQKIVKIEFGGEGKQVGKQPDFMKFWIDQFDVRGMTQFDLERGRFTHTEVVIRNRMRTELAADARLGIAKSESATRADMTVRLLEAK